MLFFRLYERVAETDFGQKLRMPPMDLGGDLYRKLVEDGSIICDEEVNRLFVLIIYLTDVIGIIVEIFKFIYFILPLPPGTYV